MTGRDYENKINMKDVEEFCESDKAKIPMEVMPKKGLPPEVTLSAIENITNVLRAFEREEDTFRRQVIRIELKIDSLIAELKKTNITFNDARRKVIEYRKKLSSMKDAYFKERMRK